MRAVNIGIVGIWDTTSKADRYCSFQEINQLSLFTSLVCDGDATSTIGLGRPDSARVMFLYFVCR